MRVTKLFYMILIGLTSFNNPNEIIKNEFEHKENLYSSINTNNFQLPKEETFYKAIEGFYSLKEKGIVEKNILTIVDFSMSSREKRMWIIDMNNNKILFNSLVAHGKNSGEDIANSFSNENQSYKSSIGFFITGETYNGKHGLSLRLDGLEKGINDNARQRGVVIHGANYVSYEFLKNHNRLGRSQGCPAIPVELSKEIIQTIKNKSCLYINS